MRVSEYARIELIPIAVEGAVDCFCGRPRDRNPYNPTYARDYFEAWSWGYDDAEFLLETRGRQEAARWLAEAA
jgi:hypothetical protein